jgi:hypothetical protein
MILGDQATVPKSISKGSIAMYPMLLSDSCIE